MKRIISIVLASIMLVGGIFVNISASADTTSKFYFNGSMSKEVLRNYVSRAVSHQCLAVNANKIDPLFEEDLRMLRRIGAKYIGRAATYSWAGNLNKNQIEYHYTLAKEQAAKIHAADPEMILQAGIFEIVYKGTVNATAVPDYVFEAFDQPVESRNFDFKKMVFPKGTIDEKGEDRGIGSWGSDQSGVPDIAQLETKMYFYNQITKYIDAGFEAFHMGQAEMMMLYRGNTYASHWDELLTKARAYAKKHARRGVALFDYHSDITSGGIKVEDRLIFDVQGAGAVPNETKIEEGAMMAELTSASDCWLSWIGRSEGGIHPLGFEIESNFTIVEFDNYGGNGNPGVATPNAFYNWGFDDITWFAVQPKWYRDQFLIESADFLKSNCLDSNGNQQYFLQPTCRRKITPEKEYFPKIEYIPGDNFNEEFLLNYVEKENVTLKYNKQENKYLLIANGFYRANDVSDACPDGFSQEDAIREIFLGKNVSDKS